jgi:nucleoside-diphosphate-sugar epimerase
MTRYLLFGANGYLGREVRRAILASGRGPHLVAVTGHEWHATDSPTCEWKRIDLVRASVEDLALLLDRSKPDVVVNCAGCTVGSMDQMEAVNVSVVRKLLDAMRRIGRVPLIHLGSAAEYGSQPYGLPIPETATPRPCGDYGRSKLVATDLILEGAAAGEVQATVLRVFDPIGSRAPAHGLAGTARREIRRAMATRATFVTLGHLSSCRDFLASADVAAAVLRVARGSDVPALLNVGRGVPMSGRSMVELLAAAAGFQGDVFESSAGIGHGSSLVWQQADLTLLRRHLGWVPTTSIVEAVSSLWQSGG